MKTPRIRYYLEKSRHSVERTNPEPIMAEINYGYSKTGKNGKRRNVGFRITLKTTILPENFGRKENNYKLDESVLKKYTRKDASVTIAKNELEQKVIKLYNQYLSQKITPTPQEFKEALQQELNHKTIPHHSEAILEYLYDKIRIYKQLQGSARKDALKAGSIKIYISLSHHIENYQIAMKETLTFGNLDEDRYWKFWTTLNEIFKGKIEVENPKQPKKQRTDPNGYSVNTIQKLQRRFLKILREAYNQDGKEVTLNLTNKNLIFKDADAIKEELYVQEEELEKIVRADVKNSPELEEAREYIIVSALTGMRYESVAAARNFPVQHYQDKFYDFLYIVGDFNKTNTEAIIPLLSHVRTIVDKHNGHLPPFGTNNEVNEKIRQLFNHLGINRKIRLVKKTLSDGTIIETSNLGEVLSSHDLRKSFYTNLIKRKVPIGVIETITHPERRPSSMSKYYNKLSLLEKAKLFIDEIKKLDSFIYKL